ncbi:HNH endonuclease [Streptomyces griseus]|uniref:HNH endonuclease n=1 Tax=Streptomyces griseus TaxID=1911 RepID=UPI00386E9092|nr:HNH endonuclease [Streptomyces fimicarius]
MPREAKLTRVPTVCAECDVPIPVRQSGPPATYCSGACRAANGYRKAREDGRYDQWLAAQRAAYEPVEYHQTCQREGCGVEFVAKRPGAKWCGDVCAMRAYNARRAEDGRLAKYQAERRQRERDQADPSEVFCALDVYERDGWICWLCSEPINQAASWPAPDSRSIDHVVALSRGGGHTLANVKAAHLRCNLVKGDRPAAVSA